MLLQPLLFSALTGEQKDLPAFEALMRQHIERSKECCLAALAARKVNRDLDK